MNQASVDPSYARGDSWVARPAGAGGARLGTWLVTIVLDDLRQQASDHEALLRPLLDGHRDECLACGAW